MQRRGHGLERDRVEFNGICRNFCLLPVLPFWTFLFRRLSQFHLGLDRRTSAAQRLRQAPEEILEDLDTEAMRLPKGPLNLNSMELGRIDGPVDCCEDSFLRFEP